MHKRRFPDAVRERRQSAIFGQKIAPKFHLAQQLEKNCTKTYCIHYFLSCTYAFDMRIVSRCRRSGGKEVENYDFMDDNTLNTAPAFARKKNIIADTISIHRLLEKVNPDSTGEQARDTGEGHAGRGDQGGGRAEWSLRPEHGRHPGRHGRASRRPGHTPDVYSI